MHIAETVFAVIGIWFTVSVLAGLLLVKLAD